MGEVRCKGYLKKLAIVAVMVGVVEVIEYVVRLSGCSRTLPGKGKVGTK